MQKNFQKPLDKRKIFAIIKVQKRKKQTKNVLILQKRGQSDEQIKHNQRKEWLVSGRRDAARNKNKEGTKSDESFPF